MLLMLHGTGGDEHDLVPLAQTLMPGAGILSPRGKVLEGTMPRFFRRLAEGVFDVEDLKLRTEELAAFVLAASDLYTFDLKRVIGVGFSNGANIGASLLLLRPGVLHKAVLFRAMVPIVPNPLPRLPRTPVLICNGEHDPLVPVKETERLASLLRTAGAEVTLLMQPVGHQLIQDDIDAAKNWLQSPGSRLSA
jgi:phospholipase/carboxylesterase/glyoxalase family protein